MCCVTRGTEGRSKGGRDGWREGRGWMEGREGGEGWSEGGRE